MGSSGNLMVNTVKQKLGAVSGPDSPTHSVSDLCGGVSATALLLCIPICAIHKVAFYRSTMLLCIPICALQVHTQYVAMQCVKWVSLMGATD